MLAYIAMQQAALAAGRRQRREIFMSYVDAALAPQRKTGQIKLHGPAAFEGMRKAGRLVAECLDVLADVVKPGVTTEHIDRLVFDFAMDNKATPATMMYRGYRKATCTSVNHVVCHGIPSEKPLKEGDIGAAIQSYVEAQHMSVVRDFCGHGLGRLFHDEPNIVHVGRPGDGVVLKAGMFFTVEPMINLGRPHVKVLSDGWTAVTRDRSLSAQFEHTVGVTDKGVEVFTFSPAGMHKPPYKV
jgi:methionyl aminopeptidase